ncbi:helix-turn-helix domain-containing protein [Devosia sp. 2618]|uniref:helix-turn-helix domain-containing protein n=1 Tax=Devosia sp. 2618 TaxID=3156454 RepID=UPI003396F001
MSFLDIGEVTQRTGLSPSALRYYEEIGLISAAARHGLRRQFSSDVLVQLKFIALGKSAGFSLEEIAGMVGKKGTSDLPRDVLRSKADDLDNQIVELTKLSDTLRHIADCSAPSHMECPTFRRLLDGAVKPKARRTKKQPPNRQ